MPVSNSMLASMRTLLDEVLSGPEPDLDAQLAQFVWAEGLMTASAIGPSPLRRDEFVDAMCPSDAEGVTPALRELFGLAQRQRYSELCEEIEDEGPNFQPEHLDGADEAKALELAADWVAGFMRGVRFRFGDWKVLFDDRSKREMFVPIIAFATAADGSPALGSLAPDNLLNFQRECLPLIGKAVFRLKLHWEEQRADAKRHGGRLGKVGRNEPCPCGSGQKYKRCCLN